MSLPADHEGGLVARVQGLDWVNSARHAESPRNSGVGGEMATSNLPRGVPLEEGILLVSETDEL